MKKIASILLTLSFILPISAGCRKNSMQLHEAASANEVPYIGDETAVFDLMGSGSSSDQASEEELRMAYTKFVFEVMKRCVEQSDTTNVLISPDSLLFALEMTAAGASGTTLDQMLQTMMPGISNTESFRFAVDRMEHLRNDSLHIANSIWINQNDSQSIFKPYSDYVSRHFDAAINIRSFQDGIVNTINKWVEGKTDGKIKNLLTPTDIDPLSIMVLINAISFESEWETALSESDIHEGLFIRGENDTQSVMFLNSTENTYLSSNDATGFIKPYKDGKFGFMALLPEDSNTDISSFISSLTPEKYWEIWNSRISSEVRVMFPEFSTDYRIELPDVLQDMGMVAPFDPASANFSLMTPDEVYIKNVIHQTHIEVNREGTTAAAATAVIMNKYGEPSIHTRSVCCNRPFVYAIVDMETGIPVFLGTCASV